MDNSAGWIVTCNLPYKMLGIGAMKSYLTMIPLALIAYDSIAHSAETSRAVNTCKHNQKQSSETSSKPLLLFSKPVVSLLVGYHLA